MNLWGSVARASHNRVVQGASGLQQPRCRIKPELEREPRLQRECGQRRGESAQNRFWNLAIIIV
eukprot:6503791-Pyramimonas_sp.AAC.1